MTAETVNLAEKLRQFSEHWQPRTVAQLNDYDVMVVKVQGEFVWHKHDETRAAPSFDVPQLRPELRERRDQAAAQEDGGVVLVGHRVGRAEVVDDFE